MASREGMINLQFWATEELKNRIELKAREAGFFSWRPYAETLFWLAINDKIKVKPVEVVDLRTIE